MVISNPRLSQTACRSPPAMLKTNLDELVCFRAEMVKDDRREGFTSLLYQLLKSFIQVKLYPAL
jgi:hypothetical protein